MIDAKWIDHIRNCGEEHCQNALALHGALALARSMILSGEQMTPMAEALIDGALGLLSQP